MKTISKPDRPESKPLAASRLRSSPTASRRAIRFKEILVPVDFSACSKKALAYAVALARQFQARITVLYTVDFEIAAADVDIDVPQVRKKLCLNGGRQLARLVRETIGCQIEADTLVRTGQPFAQIIEAARARKVDLIIMATHGNSGITRFFIGSTTERVVRHAPCPVLIVREVEREFV